MENRINNMKTYLYLLITSLLIVVSSCSDVEYASAPEMAKVSNLQCAVDGRNVILSWTMPAQAEVAGVNIQCNNDAPVILEGVVNTYTFERVALSKE